MGIDYGRKRTGIAVTDPLKLISSALETVETKELYNFIEKYLESEQVELFVIGEPLHADGTPPAHHTEIIQLSKALQKKYPHIDVVLHDERYTSVEAKEIIIKSGVKKKKRRDKSLIDKIAAALILEDYMNQNL